MTQKFHFLESMGPNKSTRTKEVISSEARSHAARISHQRAAKAHLVTRATSNSGRPTPEIRYVVSCDVGQIPYRLHSIRMEEQYWGRVRSPHPPAVSSSLSSPGNVSGKSSDTEAQEGWHISRTPGTTQRNVESYCLDSNHSLTSEVDQISTIYWNLSAPSSAQFCSMLKVKNIFTREWLQYLEDDAFFHVGAALIKGEHKGVEHLGGCADPDILFHKTKALKIIQARLAQSAASVDKATLLAILFLPFTDDLVADKVACMIHWSAAAKILAAHGGLQAIGASPGGAYIADVITQVGSFCLLHTGIAIVPSNPGLRMGPQALLTARSTLSEATSISSPDVPVGLKALHDVGLIGERTFHLARIPMQSVKIGRTGGTSPFDSTGTVQEGLTSSFQDTWGLHNTIPSTVVGEPSIEEVIRVAVMVYSARMMGPTGMVSIVSRGARAYLSIIVQKCVISRSQIEEDALYWASSVAVEAWKTRLDELAGDGAALRVFQAARFPSYMSRVVSQVVLKTFFCDEQLLRFYYKVMKTYLK